MLPKPTVAGVVHNAALQSLDARMDDERPSEASREGAIVESESATTLFYFDRQSLDDLFGSLGDGSPDFLFSSSMPYHPSSTDILDPPPLSPSPNAERPILPQSPSLSSRNSFLSLLLPSPHALLSFLHLLDDTSLPYTSAPKDVGVQVDLIPPSLPESTLGSSFEAAMDGARMQEIIEEQRRRIVWLEEEVARSEGR